VDLEQLKAYLMAQKEQAPVSDEELASQRLKAGLIDAAREGSDIMSGNEYKGPSGALQERVKASIEARKEADKRNFLLQQLANKKAAEQVVNPLQEQQIASSKATVDINKAKDDREAKKSLLENKLLGKKVSGFVSDQDKFQAEQANKAADRELDARSYEDAKEMREVALAKAKAELEQIGKIDPQTKNQIDQLEFRIRQYEEAEPDRLLDRQKKAMEVAGMVTDRERFENQKEKDKADRALKEKKLSAKDIDNLSPTEVRELTVPGFGIARTRKEAIDFRKNAADTQTIKDGIMGILEASKTSNLGPLEFSNRAEVRTKVQAIMGKLRLPMQGPGAMTDSDRKQLEELIGNPAKIFSLNSVEQRKLETILKGLENQLHNDASTIIIDYFKPITVRKDGKTATVKSESQLQDALSKGWSK
jgi:hypothetical protein